MNENIEIFIATFISLSSIITAFILAIIREKNKWGTDTDVGAGIEQAGATCESAKHTSTELAGTTEQAIRIEQDLAGTNEQLTESIATSQQILQELKKRNAK